MYEPVLPGFFPDPSICRVGDTYYLANSSFEYLPGIPLHSSTDLVTWKQIGNAYSRREQIDLRDARANAGLYAPTIRHHDGVFYLATTDITSRDEGHLIAWAKDPAGPWSVPVRTVGANGIDPDLFWDVDGTCHLTWRRFDGPEGPGIYSAQIDPLTGELQTTPRTLWQGVPGMSDSEGPHLYRRGDYYYNMLAQGGTWAGHSITIARSRSLDGPWEANPANPILTHRSTNLLPVESTGHGDLVERPDGSWALVYLGVRPRGMGPRFHVNGRETFLAAVEWVDDWPVVKEEAFDVPRMPTGFVEEFDDETLDDRWISHGGVHWDYVDTTSGPGARISVVEKPAEAPALGVRTRDQTWRAGIHADALESIALRLSMDVKNWIEVSVSEGKVRATQAIGSRVYPLSEHPLTEPVLELQIETHSFPPEDPLGHGPDLVALRVRTASGTTELERIDGRVLSTEVTTGFTGRTIGVRALVDGAHLDRFEYEPTS